MFSVSDEEGSLALQTELRKRPDDPVTVVGAGATGATALPEAAAQRRQRDTEALDVLVGAVLSGEVDAVVRLLAPDSMLHSDGGGRVSTALRPVYGADSGSPASRN